jgi:Xaa-Pro aminopeptidase
MQLYIQRLQRLQATFPTLACDALIIEDPVNLYYLTGLDLSNGLLWMTQEKAFLMVDGRYLESAKKESPFPVLLKPSNQHALELLLEQEKSGAIKRLAFNSATTCYQRFLEIQNILANIPSIQIELIPSDNPLKKLRSIKDAYEIDQLRAAAALGSKGFDFICSLLQEGITELELAIELEIFWKRQGSKGVAFNPIIAFGPNSSMPHYAAGERRLQKGQHILIDIGVNRHHYHSDMTRVVFFGPPDPQIAKIYPIVYEAQQAALALCRPGTLIKDLDEAARSVIRKAGYEKQFTHSLGHGIGLEIHEWPHGNEFTANSTSSNDTYLEAGMAITIEPGIYLPDIGGVRIEDTVIITSSGHDNLSTPHKIPHGYLCS